MALDEGELKEALEAKLAELKLEGDLTDKDVAAIMKEVDTDGNKSLDFKEFRRLLKHIEDFKSFDR